MFLKISISLYADYTILIFDDPSELQICINDFVRYCNKWNLNINKSKTKVLILGSMNEESYTFIIENIQIEKLLLINV